MSYSEKQLRLHLRHLDIAAVIAKSSYSKRLKVGSLLVSSAGYIIGTGYNGSPKDVSNVCEDENNMTYQHVLHSEINCIFNATTNNLEHATIYITHSPCVHCSASIKQKNITTVVYDELYRLSDGINFLKNNNVNVISKQEIIELLKSYE